MKFISLVLLIFCLTSCDYFDKKKVSTEELLSKELKTVDWNAVDEYPTFTSCDSAISKAEKKYCFETTITSHIFNQLNAKNFVVTKTIDDTLKLRIHISETGELQVLNLINTEHISTEIPKIDSLLIASLDSLPKIFPAIKRGQFVKTEFELPIIIKVN